MFLAPPQRRRDGATAAEKTLFGLHESPCFNVSPGATGPRLTYRALMAAHWASVSEAAYKARAPQPADRRAPVTVTSASTAQPQPTSLHARVSEWLAESKMPAESPMFEAADPDPQTPKDAGESSRSSGTDAAGGQTIVVAGAASGAVTKTPGGQHHKSERHLSGVTKRNGVDQHPATDDATGDGEQPVPAAPKHVLTAFSPPPGLTAVVPSAAQRADEPSPEAASPTGRNHDEPPATPSEGVPRPTQHRAAGHGARRRRARH